MAVNSVNNNSQNNQSTIGVNMTQQFQSNNSNEFSNNYEIKEELGK